MSDPHRTKYLSGYEILAIHKELVQIFDSEGDPISPSGPRSEDLVHSAAARPRTAHGTVEKYVSIEHKAAALFHSLVRNHPFRNGNKRTALASLAIFLDRNDRRITAEDDAAFDFVLSVANRKGQFVGNDEAVVRAMQKWIRKNSSTEGYEVSSMPTKEFLKRCQQAGGSWRVAAGGGSWVIMGPDPTCNIRISHATKKLDGKVVRSYVRTLGLSEGQTGIKLDEFQEGLTRHQVVLRRFRNVLRLLANE